MSVRGEQNQKGQATTEITLMLVLMVSVAITVSTAFRKNQYFSKLVSQPWQVLAGLIQNGVWGTPDATMSLHPSVYERISSPQPEKVKK